MMELPSPQRRSINPSLNLGVGTGLVDHAHRLGINLRSAGRIRTAPGSARRHVTTPSGYPITPERLPLSAWERPHTAVLNAPQYIQDFVVPLTLGQDESNVHQAVVQHSLRGNKTIPYMNRGMGNLSARSARSNNSASTYLSRYMTTTPVEQVTARRHDRSPRKNISDQAMRYQHEQDMRQDGLRKKRISEIRPHRLDRMYYMSGAKLGMDGRYNVDPAELDRLKEMSNARRDAAHYGRGLSAEKKKLLQQTGHNQYLETNESEEPETPRQTPRQPPPTQLEGRISAQSKPDGSLNLTVAGRNFPASEEQIKQEKTVDQNKNDVTNETIDKKHVANGQAESEVEEKQAKKPTSDNSNSSSITKDLNPTHDINTEATPAEINQREESQGQTEVKDGSEVTNGIKDNTLEREVVSVPRAAVSEVGESVATRASSPTVTS